MIKAIHHVSLLVADTARAVQFYQGVLGLEIDTARPQLPFPGAWLKVGEQQIHLLQLPNPDPVDNRPAHGGRDRHLALCIDDLEAVRAALDGAGHSYTLSASGRRALFCRDHDGNTLELIETAG